MVRFDKDSIAKYINQFSYKKRSPRMGRRGARKERYLFFHALLKIYAQIEKQKKVRIAETIRLMYCY